MDTDPTVLCPHGHPNAWHYRFCGQCGAPIGATAWPEDTPEERPPTRRLLGTAAVALTFVVIVAVGVVGFMVLRPTSEDGVPNGRPGGFSTGTASPAAASVPCGEPPAVEAESVDMTPAGLSVAAAFLSRCSGGSTERGSGVRITVAVGDRDIAAGRFDFSGAPLAMEPGVVARRTLVFPHGMYWRTPEMFSGAPELVFHPGEEREASTAESNAETLTALAVAEPEHGSIDGVADAVLAELRDNDYPYVSGSVANRWVAQISSKRPGLEVDGRTLSSADVLRDHLELRRKYNGARLVYSGQWSTFNSPDWWVTVAGPPRLTATEANAWCDTAGFGVYDCFAKFVSSVFGVEGTTVYRK